MEYRHSFVSEHICSCVRCQEIQASAAVPNPHNIRYLSTKQEKMGHLFEDDLADDAGGGDSSDPALTAG